MKNIGASRTVRLITYLSLFEPNHINVRQDIFSFLPIKCRQMTAKDFLIHSNLTTIIKNNFKILFSAFHQ